MAASWALISLRANGEGLRSPGEVAKSITGRDYLSYSQVTTYQACPLKWYYTYVDRAEPEFVAASLLLGSGVHAAIEHHLASELVGDPCPTIDELMLTFQQAWTAGAAGLPVQFSRDETKDTAGDTARRMLECYLEGPHSMVKGKILGIEEELRINLTRDLPDLVAVLDKIELREGELVITDYKTSRSMWGQGAAEEHAEQLILYAEAAKPIAIEFNAGVKLEFVVLSKTKSPKVESFAIAAAPARIDRSIVTMRRVFKSMQHGIVSGSH